MARVGNTVNLEDGSRYDLLIFDYPDGYPTTKLNLAFGTTPKRISGVEKVVQTFFRCIMTLRGSDVVHEGRGTTFGALTGNSNLTKNDLSEVRASISSAVESAARQTRSILNIPTAGLASQLDRVVIKGITQGTEGTDLRLSVVTRAGVTAPIALPFTSLGIKVNE